KLMNYMAAGCPIVSFAGSAAHLRHGVTGWIVEQADPAALASGILHLLDAPALARDLGRAAREVARRDFSWARTAEQVENVYARVLRTDHARGCAFRAPASQSRCAGAPTRAGPLPVRPPGIPRRHHARPDPLLPLRPATPRSRHRPGHRLLPAGAAPRGRGAEARRMPHGLPRPPPLGPARVRGRAAADSPRAQHDHPRG